MKFVKVILVVSAASLVYVAAATATQIDFTDEEFEDAAYHELYSLIGTFTETAPNRYCEGKSFYESKFRLVQGRITFYDISGNPNAYVYIGYFGPGETPTIDDIITKSIITYEERRKIPEITMGALDATAAYREFCQGVFPELLYTSYIILGVNREEAAYEYARSTLPKIVLWQKAAEDKAIEYFGNENVEFIGYIWGSKVNGYEYSDGERNIIIPFDMGKNRILLDPVYTREEIDANINEFKTRDGEVDRYMREAYKRFWDRQKNRIENGLLDYEDHFVDTYGTWCAFKEYWTFRWHDGWCKGHKRPIFDNVEGTYVIGGPLDIFGQCSTIAMASICMYHHFAHFIYFDKNCNQEKGCVERSSKGGNPLEFPATPYFLTVNNPGQCQCESDLWTAMFCWLMGGFYTRYDELVPRLIGYDSFYIRQPHHWLYIETELEPILKGRSIYKGVLSDFGKNYAVCLIKPWNGADYNFVISRIGSNCPFIYDYGPNHVAVYGYRHSGWQQISHLLVYDWQNDEWPSEIELSLIEWVPSEWHFEMSPPKQVTSEYAHKLKLVNKSEMNIFTWEASPSYDGDVLGYNVVARKGGVKSKVNKEIIKVEKYELGRRYKFKSRGAEDETFYLEIVFDQGNTIEYPFERDVNE
jgi:hypothetical protein